MSEKVTSMQRLQRLNRWILVLSLGCASYLPALANAANPIARLDDHQVKYKHIRNPEVLDDKVFFERVWLLIRAVQARTADRDTYQGRLDRVWKARHDDLCSPSVQSVSSLLVAEYYYSKCPPPPSPPPGRLSMGSSSATKSKGKPQWFDKLGNGREGAPSDLVDLLDEAELGKGTLVVENALGVLVETQSGSMFVDAELVDALIAAGLISVGKQPVGVEDVLGLGLALNDPTQAELLELLGVADARSTKDLLGLTDTLLSLPSYATALDRDPAESLEIQAALEWVDAATENTNPLQRFDELAERHPELGNDLLVRTLTNHEDELTDIQLRLDVEGEGETVLMKKVRPDKLRGGNLQPKRKLEIKTQDLRGFEIIPSR